MVAEALAQYNYMINVVPTTYYTSSGSNINSHQYSVTLHKKAVGFSGDNFPLPGVYFKYSFAGLKMNKVDTSTSLPNFIVRTCAILGGVYVVLGIIYRAAEKSVEMISKKKD